jgi:hypothetical protein
MRSADGLLARLLSLGIEVRADGSGLLLDGPEDALSDAVLAEVAARKQELLALLSPAPPARSAASPAALCGPGEALFVALDFDRRVVGDAPCWGPAYRLWSPARDGGGPQDKCFFRFTPEVFAWLLARHAKAKARLAAMAPEGEGGHPPAEGRGSLAGQVEQALPHLRTLKAHFLQAFPGVDLGHVAPLLPPEPPPSWDWDGPTKPVPRRPPPPRPRPEDWGTPEAAGLVAWLEALDDGSLPDGPAYLWDWLKVVEPRSWVARLREQAARLVRGEVPERGVLARLRRLRELDGWRTGVPAA